MTGRIAEHWVDGDVDLTTDESWEGAYTRFETVEEEVRKFHRRLELLGARDWPRDVEVVELFCGRGSGLLALERLGFTRVEGVDLSARLLETVPPGARLYHGDCRDLQLPDSSRDVVVTQGGLHHLPGLPSDLERTLAEAARILRPEGRLVIVEPWPTPFLSFVHAVCGIPLARRMWGKLDALAEMIEREQPTYGNWLAAESAVLECLDRLFETERLRRRAGKLMYVGRPRSA